VALNFPGYPALDVAFRRAAASTSVSLGQALLMTVTVLCAGHAKLLRQLSSEGGQISMLISVASEKVGNFSIGPQVSRLLAEAGITLELDLAV
jgi:hypothetical protein